MTARTEHLVTSGTCQLDGGSRQADNNVRLIGDDRKVLAVDAAHDDAPAELTAPETPVEIEYFGAKVPAVTAAEPLFDPEMTRIRR
ncbi:hypothetical protein [Streptomyces camelliae]|uniref:hypothetical protein n=1 Tax=Streptomyces camelliae TaxID=3004093 RepID=UPI003D176398